jgi:hypothetical protein
LRAFTDSVFSKAPARRPGQGPIAEWANPKKTPFHA